MLSDMLNFWKRNKKDESGVYLRCTLNLKGEKRIGDADSIERFLAENPSRTEMGCYGCRKMACGCWGPQKIIRG